MPYYGLGARKWASCSVGGGGGVEGEVEGVEGKWRGLRGSGGG